FPRELALIVIQLVPPATEHLPDRPRLALDLVGIGHPRPCLFHPRLVENSSEQRAGRPPPVSHPLQGDTAGLPRRSSETIRPTTAHATFQGRTGHRQRAPNPDDPPSKWHPSPRNSSRKFGSDAGPSPAPN